MRRVSSIVMAMSLMSDKKAPIIIQGRVRRLLLLLSSLKGLTNNELKIGIRILNIN